MGHARRSCQEACDSALRESDPKKLLGCLEYAITALERWYAEWDSDPGTPAELDSIQKAILALERRLKEKLEGGGEVSKPAQEFSGTTQQSGAKELRHVSRLFRVLPK